MSIEKPTIKYEWSVKDVPNLSRIHNGRRLTIAPGQVSFPGGPRSTSTTC